jgi:hypothetical protein
VNALLFASLTLRELLRRRLVAAAGVLTLVIVAFTAWGMHRLATAVVDGQPIGEPAVRTAAASIVLLLAFLFSFVLALGAALVGAPAMAESIANGEILAVLARPCSPIANTSSPTSSVFCAIWTTASIRSASLGVSPETGSRVMSLTEKIPNCMSCLPVPPC